jgi:hypothetical protein
MIVKLFLEMSKKLKILFVKIFKNLKNLQGKEKCKKIGENL